MGFGSKLATSLRMVGLDPVKLWRTLAYTPRFIGDVRRYQRQPLSGGHFPLRMGQLKPFLLDYSGEAGEIGGHYFHQDIWAARKIHQARPARHVDIGSRIDGFIAHLLTFMPVEVIDIRPLRSTVEGLSFLQADATDLAAIADKSVESLSCLHALEHFGLGRYSDPVEPGAYLRAIKAMQRIVQPCGMLYFSVPVGWERVEFNAQRVFSPRTVVDAFDQMELVSFAGVNDEGRFCPDARPEDFAKARYSCGLFEFRRRKDA